MMTSLVMILGLTIGQQEFDNKYRAKQEFFYNERDHYVARSWQQGRYTRYYDNRGFYMGRSTDYRNGSFYGKQFYDSRGRYLGQTVKTPNSYRTRIERRNP